MEPITDREIMIEIKGELKSLSQAIERFSNALTEIEDKKIAYIQRDLDDIKVWRQQITGGWKLALAIWVVFTFAAGMVIKFLFK